MPASTTFHYGDIVEVEMPDGSSGHGIFATYESGELIIVLPNDGVWPYKPAEVTPTGRNAFGKQMGTVTVTVAPRPVRQAPKPAPAPLPTKAAPAARGGGGRKFGKPADADVAADVPAPAPVKKPVKKAPVKKLRRG